MDQNQTTNDDYTDLQKAIDDITQTTKIDPVFSDPVAAPSSVPAGDTGELGEPIGPFPNVNPGEISSQLENATPTSIESPTLQNDTPFSPTTESLTSEASTSATMPQADFSTPQFTVPESPVLNSESSSISSLDGTDSPALDSSAPLSTPSTSNNSISTSDSSTPKTPSLGQDSNINDIKTAALRDIAPLIGNLQLDPAQKFGLYQDIINDLDDKTVLGPAYETTRDMTDETKRAEALLYLIKSIDEM